MGRPWVMRRSGHGGWLYQAPEAQRPKKSQRDETFLRLTLTGTEGSIAWGYHQAAVVSRWRIAKDARGVWQLTATAARLEPFYLRQTQPALIFTAPRAQASHWCWPVQQLSYQGSEIRATLGQVEF